METISMRATFDAEMPDEASAVSWLVARRWPDGVVCASCGGRNVVRMKSRPHWHCRSCKFQTSLRARTPLHRSRKPLRDWVYLMWQAIQRGCASARQIQRELGYSSYETGWSMGHKVRATLADSGAAPLEVPDAVVGFERVSVPRRATGDPGERPAALLALCVENPPFPRAGTEARAVVVGDQWETAASIVEEVVVFCAAPPTRVARADARNDDVPPWDARHRRDIVDMQFRDLAVWLRARFGGVSRRYLPNYLAQWLFSARSAATTALVQIGARVMCEPFRPRHDTAADPLRRHFPLGQKAPGPPQAPRRFEYM